ncbi:hypothetical protein PIIN_08516 [Serendipita indica DSM 11827]|uniref:Extracellular membrane protein CFEM domain-containing protein n=1 Tax=Serendipita indica (strain DSM 11827) TaxID=1109443 RepID=G4TTC1_SERID|nr:hypothetical protein PIIN_08516 [Serendipita indica DSM 11827]
MAKHTFLGFLLLLIFGVIIVKAAETPAGCTNYACEYCDDLAASCQDTPSATQNGTECLCTERFRVNLDRCIRGYTCAWDGVSTGGSCTDVYCPGSGMDAFVAQCGLGSIPSGVNSNTMAPSSISPTPRPQTVTLNSSITTSSTQTANSTTITGTGTSSPNTGGASSLRYKQWIAFTVVLGITAIVY